jgi:hypothetical protein
MRWLRRLARLWTAREAHRRSSLFSTSPTIRFSELTRDHHTDARSSASHWPLPGLKLGRLVDISRRRR